MLHAVSESTAMRFLRRCGFESLAWSLRRLHCPVDEHALVLEVGSGGNPYIRANVLLDAYEETGQRHWVPLVSDRPTVMGFVENLPFRDNVFDFVIASHVLEHSSNPDKFISELQRVAKAGYIEVPDAFMERIIPYPDHRLEITMRDSRLIIFKKPSWQTDPILADLYNQGPRLEIGNECLPRHPFAFHVRYYWEGKIDYVVLNPDIDPNWVIPESIAPSASVKNVREAVRRGIISVLRRFLSQARRNKEIELLNLLRCPACHSERMQRQSLSDLIVCPGCNSSFPVKNDIPQFCFPHDQTLTKCNP